jgi:hypothetical protein
MFEPPIQVILLSPNLGSRSEGPDSHKEVDRDQGLPSVSWWDKVAEKWPSGGRFPSLIVIDQSI